MKQYRLGQTLHYGPSHMCIEVVVVSKRPLVVLSLDLEHAYEALPGDLHPRTTCSEWTGHSSPYPSAWAPFSSPSTPISPWASGTLSSSASIKISEEAFERLTAALDEANTRASVWVKPITFTYGLPEADP